MCVCVCVCSWRFILLLLFLFDGEGGRGGGGGRYLSSFQSFLLFPATSPRRFPSTVVRFVRTYIEVKKTKKQKHPFSS